MQRETDLEFCQRMAQETPDGFDSWPYQRAIREPDLEECHRLREEHERTNLVLKTVYTTVCVCLVFANPMYGAVVAAPGIAAWGWNKYKKSK